MLDSIFVSRNLFGKILFRRKPRIWNTPYAIHEFLTIEIARRSYYLEIMVTKAKTRRNAMHFKYKIALRSEDLTQMEFRENDGDICGRTRFQVFLYLVEAFGHFAKKQELYIPRYLLAFYVVKQLQGYFK